MSEILVAVVPKPGTEQFLSGQISFESFENRAQEIGRTIASVAQKIRDSLEAALGVNQSAKYSLDAIDFKFSLDLEAEAGVVIARAKTSAGFEVTLSWKTTPVEA